MLQVRKGLLLLGVWLLLTGVSVFSDSLSYDMATGTLSGFDVNTSDTSSSPGSFANGTEVWNTPGFVGRLVYIGPPTALIFSNSGPNAQNASNNRFYFTYVKSNGQSDTDRWREFFLVLRAKGMRHNNTQHDFSQINTVAEHPGDLLAIPYGAGSEEVAIGQTGYNATGGQGVYNGSNGYNYRYPYRHIWVDVTLMRTNTKRRLSWGFYESEITVVTQQGASHILRLNGKYGYSTADPPPIYAFSVNRTIDNQFPFAWLEGRNTYTQALTIGRCVYNSEDCSATIRFASDSGGTSDQFFFRSNDGQTFPFALAFDATKPDRAVLPITATSEFATASQTIYSPIDSSSHQLHVLEGDIQMYLPYAVDPCEGIYTSYIYCFVTTSDW